MNMLAGPQPYGGSRRPLPFATRPPAETSTGGEAAQEAGKEEAGKEETPPLTPPARCAAPGGVRKAPAPFRPASERFAATTVEEILAKMEQPRKEVPASSDRLWGSRLTFNHDGSSKYGPRTYGVAAGPVEEDGGTLSREWSQEGPAKSPTECPEEPSQALKERSPALDRAFNGDLAQLATSEPPTDVSKPWVPSSPGPTAENGGFTSPGLPAEVSGAAPESRQLHSPRQSSPRHSAHLPEVQSPATPGPSPRLPATPASPAVALPEEGACHAPGPGLSALGAPDAPRTSGPPAEKVSGSHGPEQPPAASPPPPMEGGEPLDPDRTFPSGEEAAGGEAELCPAGLGQRRFSEGVLRLPDQDQKLGGSLADLLQTQGGQSALDRPFGCGTESNWSLSQSFEWTFPTRPSGLGVWRLDSPPPSPITEASEAAEAEAAAAEAAAAEAEAVGAEAGATVAGDLAASGGQGVFQQGPGVWSAPEGPGRPGSWVQTDDSGIAPSQKGDGESQPPSPADTIHPLPTTGGPPEPALLQAEERYEEQEPPAGREAPLSLASGEAALSVLEPVLGRLLPATPEQPCVLFADTPGPGKALPAEEEAVTLARAETIQPGTEAQDPCRASPEPAGPESSSRWLDDLLASPPPSAGCARRGAGPELKDAQTPSACSEGLLGWAQKDLRSEFGIAADTQPGSFSSSRWSQDTSQDYGLRDGSPRGDPPGLGEGSWPSKSGQGAGEGSPREWAGRCGVAGHEEEAEAHEEEAEAGGPCGSGGLPAQDRVIGKPAPLGTQQSQEPDAQDWEFRKRDSRGTYSSRDVELQDQEFGKRDLLGSYSSQDASLQDWEFGKRDSLGAYAGQDTEDGRKQDHPGKYSSQDAAEQDQEFGKRDSSLGIFGSQGAEQPADLDFGKSAWMRGYSSHGGTQDRGFGPRALSTAFSPEEAKQQDEEFGKTLSGGDGPAEASGDAGQPEDRELGGLFSPGSPRDQDGAPGPRVQSSWQELGGAGQEVGGLRGRQQAGDQSPGDAQPEDGEVGRRGWAGDFSLGVASQPEAAFSPGQRDWSGDFCMEVPERSHHFGVIGHDRVGGAGGPSPPGKVGGGHFVSPEKNPTGSVDWTDQLGLRNLDVSSCVGSSGISSGAREGTVGQSGWSDSLRLRDVDPASHLEAGGPQEPREMGVGEKDWTSDVGVRGRDLAGVGDAERHSQARESGVGQTNWSGVEAGDFLKSRERGVGQASWTPDLGLRNMAVGPESSSRELGVGQVDWGDRLGLRNLEVPYDLETGGSREPRGCGVGQMDWTQDLGLRDVELSGTPREAREHGVGEVSQCPEPGLRDAAGILCPGQEARELGVGEMSGPETQGEDDSSLSLETCSEGPGAEMGEAPGFGASPSSGCPARSPPAASQGLPEGMPARRESAASSSGPRTLLEEAGSPEGADGGEPPEPGSDRPPSWRPQPDGEASRTEEVDGTWGPAGAGLGEQGPARPPRRPSQGPPPSSVSQDFSFIEDTEILDSAVYRSRANLGRKRGHRAPAIRPGGTLGLSEAADSDARLFQDSTEPRASRVPSSDEEVAEEPQNRRTRMSLGTKGLKVNLFPGLSPAALKAKLRPRNRSAEEGELVDSKSSQKESAFQRSKSCKVPGLGKPLALPPKPEKSSGSEGSSPSWLQALKLKKKKV